MWGDVGRQSRNEIVKLGGAGFTLLKVKLSFQVQEPGFWGMFVIYYAIGHDAAARKFDSDC